MGLEDDGFEDETIFPFKSLELRSFGVRASEPGFPAGFPDDDEFFKSEVV